MKKICAVITAVSMLLCSPTVVQADNSEDSDYLNPIQVRYTYIRTAESRLSIIDKMACCESACSGGAATTKIEATQYLEKSTWWWWDPVDDWSASVNGNNLEMTNYKYDLDSGTYHLRTVFTIYVDGDSETIEVTSREVTI